MITFSYNEISAKLDRLLDMQRGTSHLADEYNRGIYNGIEFVRSSLLRQEPIYCDETGELDREAVDRNPERFI